MRFATGFVDAMQVLFVSESARGLVVGSMYAYIAAIAAGSESTVHSEIAAAVAAMNVGRLLSSVT